MEVEAELKRLGKEFRKLYESISLVEVKSDLDPKKDNYCFKEVEAGEFIEILKVPQLEKGIVIGIQSRGREEFIGKFPCDKLNYDLAVNNPYLQILKIYVDEFNLLETHFKKNPTTKILEMMSCVSLSKVLFLRIFEEQIQIKGVNFLELPPTSFLLNRMTKMLKSSETTKIFLANFSKIILDQLEFYPIELSKSPRSEGDLLSLETTEREILYQFYINVAEKGILYIYDENTIKPYYVQVFLRALKEIISEYSTDFEWKEIISKWFFTEIIIPHMKAPPPKLPSKSPRSKESSPRNLEVPKSRQRKNSLNAGIEKFRNSFSGNFRLKFGSTGNNSSLQGEELECYWNDIGKIYSSLFEEESSSLRDSTRGLSKLSKHLKFTIANFSQKLLTPTSPKPVSESDYYYEIDEIYREIIEFMKELDPESRKRILVDLRKPSREKCLECQEYMDRQFLVSGS